MKKIISLILLLALSLLALTSCAGKAGASAYEKAVAEGFTGSVTEWLASLKGEDGKTAEGPEIIDGYWYVGGKNTGVKAEGDVTNIDITAEAPLAGKTIVNFGDSLFGMAQTNDISSYLAEITGATVINMGFGGCRMGKHYSTTTGWDAFSMYNLANAIYQNDFSMQDNAIEKDKQASPSQLPYYFRTRIATLKEIDFNKVDIITIAYGTNDFTGELPLEGNSRYDCGTFSGAMRYSIELLHEKYPHLNIVICTPTYRAWLNSTTFAVTEDSDAKVNGKGATLHDFIDYTYAIAEEYKLPVVNLYHDLGINAANRTYFFPRNDGTHHNEFGRLLIAKLIAKKLF